MGYYGAVFINPLISDTEQVFIHLLATVYVLWENVHSGFFGHY